MNFDVSRTDTFLLCFQKAFRAHKGVYPHSDGRLAMAFDEYIDASKGLVALWEHFFVAIVAIHRNG